MTEMGSNISSRTAINVESGTATIVAESNYVIVQHTLGHIPIVVVTGKDEYSNVFIVRNLTNTQFEIAYQGGISQPQDVDVAWIAK